MKGNKLKIKKKFKKKFKKKKNVKGMTTEVSEI